MITTSNITWPTVLATQIHRASTSEALRGFEEKLVSRQEISSRGFEFCKAMGQLKGPAFGAEPKQWQKAAKHWEGELNTISTLRLLLQEKASQSSEKL